MKRERTDSGRTDRTILVVGSWAKEQITIEHLAGRGLEVGAFMDTPNPAIAAATSVSAVGRLSDRDAIVRFARDIGADTVLITTAGPLAAGVADALTAAGITAFGPSGAAARLESDKAFARDLLERARIDASPPFRVCASLDEASRFAADLDWDVAVKPLGLTDGLGVRVAGDHLRDEDEVRQALAEVLDGRHGDDRRVLVEQRLTGEEFTIQCLAHGRTVIPTPPVQDFKRLRDGDRGPNTGSMGSYTSGDGLLPFLNEDDLETATAIIRSTVTALEEIEGITYTGFLYGQFMRTAAGIRLIEFNARPGDPEWINTVDILEDNLIDLVDAVLEQRAVAARTRPCATVCLYGTPPGYPQQRDCELDVTLDERSVRRAGAAVYLSCGLVDGRLRVGSERGLAVIAEGDDIPQARRRAIEALENGVQGDFHHRSDIGSREMIAAKRARGPSLRTAGLRIRRFREHDAGEVAHLLQVSPPLEAYPLHLLHIANRCFGRTCWVAEIEGEIVGWLMGLGRDHDPDCWFLWQIGVRPSAQRRGVARRLLEQAETELAADGYLRIEVTVAPDNPASLGLFRAAGYRTQEVAEPTVMVRGEVADAHHYGPGRHFVLLEKRIAPTLAETAPRTESVRELDPHAI